MSCIRFKKQIRKLGQFLSKMATIKYNLMDKSKDSCYTTLFDSEIDKTCSGRYNPSLSSDFSSPYISPGSSKTPSLNGDDKMLQLRELGANYNNKKADNIWDINLPVPQRDLWPNSNIPQQQAREHSSRFESFFSNQFEAFSVSENDYSSYAYSPLSSPDSNFTQNSYDNFYCLDNVKRMQAKEYEFIRQDFMMNGYDPDVNFQPSATSTPNFSRREVDWDQNYQFAGHAITVNSMEQRYFQVQAHSQSKNFKQQLNFAPRKMKKQGKPNKKSLEDHCVFCKNNGVEKAIYMSHTVKDSQGRTLCPKLRLYKCPICGMDGDNSHTLKYCPQKKIVTMEDLSKMENGKLLPKF